MADEPKYNYDPTTPLSPEEQGWIENTRFKQLKALVLKGGIPVYTATPTHIGVEGEIASVDTGSSRSVCIYLNGTWRCKTLAEITSSDITTALGYTPANEANVETTVYKSADETLTADTATQNDDHLLFTVAANTTYRVDVLVFFTLATNNGAGGLQDVTFGLPAGATWDSIWIRGLNGSSPLTVNEASDIDDNLTANGDERISIFQGIITVGGTGGTANFKWGAVKNNPGDVVTVTVKKGSYLTYQALS